MPGLLNVPQAPGSKTGFGDDDGHPAIDQYPLEELDRSKSASPFLTPAFSRSLTASPVSTFGRLSPYQSRAPSPTPAPQHPPTWKAAISRRLGQFWGRNRAVILVAAAQFFGSLMNLAARLLEVESGMHPLQILFGRMSMTTILSCLYMWYNKTPHFPLGPKGIRRVLVIRGVSGFVCIGSQLFVPQPPLTQLRSSASTECGTR